MYFYISSFILTMSNSGSVEDESNYINVLQSYHPQDYLYEVEVRWEGDRRDEHSVSDISTFSIKDLRKRRSKDLHLI